MEKQEQILRDLPEVIRAGYADMTEAQKRHFIFGYKKQQHTTLNAFVFWLLFGLHYAYYGRWIIQIIFWLTAGGLLVWWIIDLFRLPALTVEANEGVAKKVMIEVKSLIK